MDRVHEFVYFKVFDKNWARLGLTDDDLIFLEKTIMENPNGGELIQGTGGLRKMRFALPHTGKSSGARVLYVDFISYEHTAVLDVYAKNEQISLTDREKQAYKEAINIYLKGLR